MTSKGRIAFIFLIMVSMLGLPVLADRTPLKQGGNLFTVKQDIEMGRELAEEADNTLALVTDSYAIGYIQALGSQLAAHAPGTKYPYQFKIVNDKNINAFALPGGFIYITSGYGMRIASFDPQDRGFFGQNSLNIPGSQRSSGMTLEKATDQLLDELRRPNPNMRVIRDNERGRVDGEPSMTIELTNDSPVGGRETDWLVTVLRPDGLLYYFVGVAPQRDFHRYSSTFEQIVASVQFND